MKDIKKKKFKVVSSTKPEFNNIEFDFVIDNEEIGTVVNVLGGKFKITQNGVILVLVGIDGNGIDKWVLTLQELSKPEPEIDDKLLPNRDYDIFFETKTFKIHETPVTKKGITYKKFFETVREEWDTVSKLRNDPFPMKYNDKYDVLTFTHDWTWDSDDFKYLINGSWGRESADGRSF